MHFQSSMLFSSLCLTLCLASVCFGNMLSGIIIKLLSPFAFIVCWFFFLKFTSASAKIKSDASFANHLIKTKKFIGNDLHKVQHSIRFHIPFVDAKRSICLKIYIPKLYCATSSKEEWPPSHSKRRNGKKFTFFYVNQTFVSNGEECMKCSNMQNRFWCTIYWDTTTEWERKMNNWSTFWIIGRSTKTNGKSVEFFIRMLNTQTHEYTDDDHFRAAWATEKRKKEIWQQ